jgi:hypothetical protein
VSWWLAIAGTGEWPYTEADRQTRPERHRFARRPRIERGDMLVVYASGSAREYGEGRVFALEEVISDEPEPSGDERWRWQLRTRRIVSMPLAVAPTLRDLGVSARSVGRHSHIRLSDRQGEIARELFDELAARRRPRSARERR